MTVYLYKRKSTCINSVKRVIVLFSCGSVGLLRLCIYSVKRVIVLFSCGSVGLLRFLELLSTFDWKSTPLLVNLNQEFTGKCFTGLLNRCNSGQDQCYNLLILLFIKYGKNKKSIHSRFQNVQFLCLVTVAEI